MSSGGGQPDADLLVVGGGPAGLGAAIAARLAGLSVIVLEKREGVIDKACGEGLMPAAVAHLDRLGVHPPVTHPFVGIRYLDARRPGLEATGDFPTGVGLGVRRIVLHEALAIRAMELGVRTERVKVDSVEQDASGVTAGGLRGRWLIAADGLRSPIRRRLGLELGPSPGVAPRYGIRRHYRTQPWTDRVEVHWGPSCEAYVTPVAASSVGVAVLFSRADGRSFEGWLDELPALRERLGEPVTPASGAGPFEQRVRQRVAGRVLLVGDAAGYLDPLTGEGIALALTTGELAVQAIVAGNPEDYEAQWQRATRTYYRLTGALLWSARSRWVRPRLVQLAAMSPWVFDRVLGALGGSEVGSGLLTSHVSR